MTQPFTANQRLTRKANAEVIRAWRDRFSWRKEIPELNGIEYLEHDGEWWAGLYWTSWAKARFLLGVMTNKYVDEWEPVDRSMVPGQVAVELTTPDLTKWQRCRPFWDVRWWRSTPPPMDDWPRVCHECGYTMYKKASYISAQSNWFGEPRLLGFHEQCFTAAERLDPLAYDRLKDRAGKLSYHHQRLLNKYYNGTFHRLYDTRGSVSIRRDGRKRLRKEEEKIRA